eukprot:Gb_21746 [translate_table: standard]
MESLPKSKPRHEAIPPTAPLRQAAEDRVIAGKPKQRPPPSSTSTSRRSSLPVTSKPSGPVRSSSPLSTRASRALNENNRASDKAEVEACTEGIICEPVTEAQKVSKRSFPRTPNLDAQVVVPDVQRVLCMDTGMQQDAESNTYPSETKRMLRHLYPLVNTVNAQEVPDFQRPISGSVSAQRVLPNDNREVPRRCSLPATTTTVHVVPNLQTVISNDVSVQTEEDIYVHPSEIQTESSDSVVSVNDDVISYIQSQRASVQSFPVAFTASAQVLPDAQRMISNDVTICTDGEYNECPENQKMLSCSFSTPNGKAQFADDSWRMKSNDISMQAREECDVCSHPVQNVNRLNHPIFNPACAEVVPALERTSGDVSVRTEEIDSSNPESQKLLEEFCPSGTNGEAETGLVVQSQSDFHKQAGGENNPCPESWKLYRQSCPPVSHEKSLVDSYTQRGMSDEISKQTVWKDDQRPSIANDQVNPDAQIDIHSALFVQKGHEKYHCDFGTQNAQSCPFRTAGNDKIPPEVQKVMPHSMSLQTEQEMCRMNGGAIASAIEPLPISSLQQDICLETIQAHAVEDDQSPDVSVNAPRLDLIPEFNLSTSSFIDYRSLDHDKFPVKEAPGLKSQTKMELPSFSIFASERDTESCSSCLTRQDSDAATCSTPTSHGKQSRILDHENEDECRTQEKGTIQINEKLPVHVRPAFNDVIHVIRHSTFRVGGEQSTIETVEMDVQNMDISSLRELKGDDMEVKNVPSGTNATSHATSQPSQNVLRKEQENQVKGLDVRSYRQRADALEGLLELSAQLLQQHRLEELAIVLKPFGKDMVSPRETAIWLTQSLKGMMGEEH